MMRYWKKACYLDASLPSLLRSAIVISLFVFLILFIFRPFGLSQLNAHLLRISIGFGLVTMISTTFLGLILYLITQRSNLEEQWTIGKEIGWNLLHFVLIAFANAAFAHRLGMIQLNLENLLIFFCYTVAVGAFPVSLIIMFREMQNEQRYRTQAAELNEHIHDERVPERANPELIQIPSNTQSEDLKLPLDELLMIHAQGNYLEVWCATNDGFKKHLIRNTMKEMESLFESFDHVIRCHKSYLVNWDKVVRVSGNAQGYRLHFEAIEESALVSRKLNSLVKDLIHS